MRVGFDGCLKLKFLGSQITTDAGLLAYRELDETLGLTILGADVLTDSRQGSNTRHGLLPLLRQSIYSRLAGYTASWPVMKMSTTPSGFVWTPRCGMS